MTKVNSIMRNTIGITVGLLVTLALSYFFRDIIIANMSIRIGYSVFAAVTYLVAILGKDEIYDHNTAIYRILDRTSKLDILIGILIPFMYFTFQSGITLD